MFFRIFWIHGGQNGGQNGGQWPPISNFLHDDMRWPQFEAVCKNFSLLSQLWQVFNTFVNVFFMNYFLFVSVPSSRSWLPYQSKPRSQYPMTEVDRNQKLALRSNSPELNNDKFHVLYLSYRWILAEKSCKSKCKTEKI